MKLSGKGCLLLFAAGFVGVAGVVGLMAYSIFHKPYVSIRTYTPTEKIGTAEEVLHSRIKSIGGSEATRKLVALDRGRFSDLTWLRGRWTFSSGEFHGQMLSYAAVNEKRRET